MPLTLRSGTDNNFAHINIGQPRADSKACYFGLCVGTMTFELTLRRRAQRDLRNST